MGAAIFQDKLSFYEDDMFGNDYKNVLCLPLDRMIGDLIGSSSGNQLAI